MKILRALALFTFVGILFGLLIYWREYADNAGISLVHVLLWQIVIWIPWAFSFKVFEKVVERADKLKLGMALLFLSGLLWVAAHFAWFFLISSSFSPYLGQRGSGFGVFPYFFIFWTLIDIGLVWFVVDRIKRNADPNAQPPLLLELTRGNSKYICEPSQISLLTSENYYTKLFTTEGVFVMRKPLKHFQDILPTDVFKRIHRSTIINVNYVSELASGRNHRLEIIMKDGTRRSVSRNFTKDIILFFKDRTS
ncbi:hypothetical protein HME9304_02778 [Flagellimonas maritima]|uniref:HTH LytTR-type domain-containing protein n=1 Tax=Flagellimonas maritima TaxID=1383885 RepID=A0A2Z4LVI5_9FLAO|nr:LytTR family DNA-binding domain-containing protein [Allomuricauda aurantiaca]AWX45749.1 hypothetical protein HME9304_02778 [Allomuricauda aurantiaca]